MTVALADAYRSIVITTQTTSGGIPGIATSTRPAGSFNLDAGFGISLVADAVNNKVTIVNTGNGTGALTTITDINTAGTYYPIFTRAGAPGDINPVAGTYQMDTMYLDQTTTPMTYAPSTSTLSLSNIGVLNTATLGNALVGQSSSANFTRFPAAQVVVSNASTIQQNSISSIGVIAEAVASSQDAVGVFGQGYQTGFGRGTGVTGRSIVTASGSAQQSIGVYGIANGIHSGGPNVGLWGYATNGSSNYALYMEYGDIASAQAQTWTVIDNNASALSIDATGKTGILKVVTTNAAEGVTMSGTLTVTGHVTLEGVTSTGATGTGNLVFDASPTLSGHPTIEGVTSTGATGTGKFVFDGSPTIASPTITSGLGIRDTTAAFNVIIGATSTSAILTANRVLTLDVGDAARTVRLNGNLSLGGTFTTNNNFTVAGAYESTITTGGVFNATFPGGTYTVASTNGLSQFSATTSAQLAGVISDETGTGELVFGTSPTFSGTVTLAPTSFEQVNISATQATGTVNIDVDTNTVFYYTADALANWTFNFRGDGTTSLNTFLPIGKSVTVAFLVTQGVAAFFASAFTVDSNSSGTAGYTYTIKWLGGSAPTGGNSSSIDSYSFTIIKTADKTFTILASTARFG